MIVARLQATAEIGTGQQGVCSAIAYVNGGCATPSWCWSVHPFLSVTIDNSAVEEAFGVNGVQHIAPLRWTIGGTALSSEMIESCEYEETDDGHVAWSIVLARRADRVNAFEEPLGTPWEELGPPGNKQAVDLDMVLLTPNGPREVAIMRDGLIHNSSGKRGAKDTRTISGTGPMGRYLKRVAELSYPAGHNQLRGVVAEQLLLASGVPAEKIALGAVGSGMLKEIEVDNQSGVEVARDILEAELKTLVFDGTGTAIVRTLGFDPDERVEYALDNVMLSPGLDDQEDINGPTRVRMTASRPSTDDTCSLVSEEYVTEVFRTYGIKGGQAISSGCSLSTALPTSTAYRLVQRSIVSQTKRCGTVVAQKSSVYAYINPETWYQTTNPTPTCNASASLQTGTGVAVFWHYERFRLAQEDNYSKTFDETTGFILSEVREKYAWKFIEAARWQQSSPTSGWSEYVIGGTYQSLTVDGRQVNIVGGLSAFRLIEREVVEYEVNAEGFITGETHSIYRWSINATSGTSNVYMYNNGSIGVNPYEEFELVETRTVVYSESSATRHLMTTTTSEYGRFSVVAEEREGYLPAAEILSEAIANDESYDELPDPSRQVYASPTESEFEECWVNSPALEEKREISELQASHPWVETKDECEAYCYHLIREGSKIPLRFSVPGNGLIRAGHRIGITAGGVDLDRIKVEKMRIQQNDGGVVTSVDAAFYPEDVTPE